MVMCLNRVEVIGHVGQDPEIRSTGSGFEIAGFSVAATERWKDRNSGEQKERTEWFRVSVMNEALVKLVEKAVHKGDAVYIEGQLRTRKWQDQSGADRYTTEVVLGAFNSRLLLLSPKREEDDGRGAPAHHGSRPSERRDNRSSQDLDDDSIPF